MKKIIFIGNGILSLMTALRIIQKDEKSDITIIGPKDREGCASVAAPAMLNSYAELIRGSLDTKIDRKKFKISQLASLKWKTIFDSLEEFDVPKAKPEFGTYILNNATTDSFDDDNFNAIVNYLKEFKEDYEFVNPNDIPGYNPTSAGRAIRALYMKNEGFINSESVLDYLVDYLKNKGIKFINNKVYKLNSEKNNIISVTLENNEELKGDIFQLSSGATFSQILDNSDLDLRIQRVLYGSGVTIEIKPKEFNFTKCVRTPNRGLACGVYSAPRTKDTMFIGASNYIADYPLHNGMLTSIESLLKAAMEQINSSFYNAGFIGTKVGWRPTTQDTYPLIGKVSKYDNLFIATGTKRDGFHSSPVISEFMTSLIFNEKYEHEKYFSHFTPEREIIKNISREKAIIDIVEHQISAMYQHDFVPPKSNMLNEYKNILRKEAENLHDKIGAFDWGIPPELYGVYKDGYLQVDTCQKK
ncbi:NAD(P)/FAD-dependent oxidoreductase [Aliarcobacter butzleri]|uniref:NAD(P)/FAD-dependent oxidoreductase n=1 Tax=Aliarcobacter butzleri TaxID=28197 RepID=UPI00125F89B5|nr:FAD-dependent oxidoreductase [Aliarcobacter butzleri]MDK2064884.1 FAD-dependent oxidoreductase [Aliarcobacter butzleri]